MRGAAVFLVASAGCSSAIAPEHWTCDFDASESRPLRDPGTEAGADGALPLAECQATCGDPATSCTLTVLDGGMRGAVCPVCTF